MLIEWFYLLRHLCSTAIYFLMGYLPSCCRLLGTFLMRFPISSKNVEIIVWAHSFNTCVGSEPICEILLLIYSMDEKCSTATNMAFLGLLAVIIISVLFMTAWATSASMLEGVSVAYITCVVSAAMFEYAGDYVLLCAEDIEVLVLVEVVLMWGHHYWLF